MDTPASDQFRTNLMVSIMSLLHPSAYVRSEISALSFVPSHVKDMVMTAFADAIEVNLTHTDQLEKALCELFVDTPDHVAFCSEPGSLNFKMDPRTFADDNQRAERLNTEMKWDHVPLVHGEAGAPLREAFNDMRIRRSAAFAWDPIQNKARKYDPADTDREG